MGARKACSMLDLVRTSLHRVITTKRGDALLPVRLPKDLARRVNVVLGEPLCSEAELERRRSARAKLDALRSGRAKPAEVAKERAAAPVMVYFEKERNARLLGRIEEVLQAKRIAYTLLDVTGDESTKDFVMREAKCKEDELPIVFIAGAPVGGFEQLVAFDVAGKLEKAVFGAA
jgi:glutaredoxin